MVVIFVFYAIIALIFPLLPKVSNENEKINEILFDALKGFLEIVLIMIPALSVLNDKNKTKKIRSI